MYNDIKTLRLELSRRQQTLVDNTIKTSKVICSTCVGAGIMCLEKEIFDYIIIDEAGQTIELSCYIPILKGKIIILAGDHLQLPPTILSPKNQQILEKTLLEIIVEKFPYCVIMLNIQYRMNKIISDWASTNLYNNELTTNESNSNIILKVFLLIIE